MRYFVKLNSDEIRTMPRGVAVRCPGNYFNTEDEAQDFINDRNKTEKKEK